MADSQVQLPYVGTTSGDLLDASSLVVGAQTVKRERMVIGNDTSSHVAVVTTSGALTVTRSTAVSMSSQLTITVDSANNIIFGYIAASTAAGGIVTGTTDRGLKVDSTQPHSISSGTISLSSAIAISSGIVTLSSPTSLSSGLVTLTGTNIVQISSGYITLMASSGSAIPATSSGGLLVALSNASAGGGSTSVSIEGAAGVEAPVTSSYGLQISSRTTGRTFGILRSSVGAPVTQVLTTLPLWMYSLTVLTTVAGTAGNAIAVHSVGASALSSMLGLMQLTNIAAAGPQFQYIFPNGVNFSNGLQITVSVSHGTTGTNTASPFVYNIEYEV